MKLKEELAAFGSQMAEQAPEDVLQTIGSEIAGIAESGIMDKALKVGDKAPNFSLNDSEGNSVSLSDLLTKGSVIISFNRGNWCPFCNIEFKHMQNTYKELQNANSNLVVISPQLPDKSAELKEQNGFEYPILHDKDNLTAKNYGIAFSLPEKLRPIHEAFGMDIPAHNGDNKFELPIPAVYVVDQSGEVVFADVNPNWMERAEPEEYLNALNTGTHA